MRLMSSALVAALALAVPAMAQDTTAKKPKATYSKKDTKTVKATVKSIDVATRHHARRAGPRVRGGQTGPEPAPG